MKIDPKMMVCGAIGVTVRISIVCVSIGAGSTDTDDATTYKRLFMRFRSLSVTGLPRK